MKLNETEQKIMDYVTIRKEPISPSEISSDLKLNDSTVRVYCRRLTKRGLLYQPIPGYYSALTPYGDGCVSALLVHDLRLVADVPVLCSVVKRPDERFIVGSTRVLYQFGRRYGRFSVTVGSGVGLNYGQLVEVLDRVQADVERFFGVDVVFDCSFHMNRDLSYVRLDGFSSLTIGELKGCFKRIYQKEGGVRVEVGVSNVRLDELVNLVQGSFDVYSFGMSIRRSVENVEKTVKEINRKVSQIQINLDKQSTS